VLVARIKTWTIVTSVDWLLKRSHSVKVSEIDTYYLLYSIIKSDCRCNVHEDSPRHLFLIAHESSLKLMEVVCCVKSCVR
jgi:hypothetical protein